MKKAIGLALATALLAAPAIAGTSEGKDTAAKQASQQNAASQTPQPGSPSDKRDDAKKGLSRNPEDCNKGCIGGNPP
jgi:hypothetical protein